jgi:hypothetical protein
MIGHTYYISLVTLFVPDHVTSTKSEYDIA